MFTAFLQSWCCSVVPFSLSFHFFASASLISEPFLFCFLWIAMEARQFTVSLEAMHLNWTIGLMSFLSDPSFEEDGRLDIETASDQTPYQ